jgi:hypothetical protein
MKMKEEALHHTLQKTHFWNRLWTSTKTDYGMSECDRQKVRICVQYVD